MADKLYWNAQGCVCCEKHVPYRGSDTWRNEQWAKVPKLQQTAHLVCESCRHKVEAHISEEARA